MTEERRRPEGGVLPVHFEDRVERLFIAYPLRAFEWKTIDLYGQLGDDGGRDICGVRKTGETECFHCANHRALKFKKVEEDLAKLVAGPLLVGDCCRVRLHTPCC